MKYLISLVCTITSILALVNTNAYAGLFPTPPTLIASTLGYRACLKAAELDGVVTWSEEAACAAIVFDPSPGDVTSMALSITFDANKFEVSSTPLFFGDFNSSRAVLPLVTPVLGAVMPFESIPDISVFNIADALIPRAGMTYLFEVDNVLGTVFMSMDLSANPIPFDAEAQNFFGIELVAKNGLKFSEIEYFDSGDNFDLAQVSFECTKIDDQTPSCGSETPVTGVNFTLVPEPTSLILMILGVLGLLMRKQYA